MYKALIESKGYIVESFKNTRYTTVCTSCQSVYRGTISDYRAKNFRCLSCEEIQKMKEIEEAGFGIQGKTLKGFVIKCANCDAIFTKKYSLIKRQGFRCTNCEAKP